MSPEPAWSFRVTLAVLWGDMDALGHVNNLVYLRWFEEARIRHAREAGLMDLGGVGVILAHQRCDYLAPLTYPDTVEVRMALTRVGTRSFTLAFAVRSEALGRDVARGEGVLVAFDYATQRSVPLPEQARVALRGMGT